MFYNRLLRKRDNSTQKKERKTAFSAEMGGFEGHIPPYTALWKGG